MTKRRQQTMDGNMAAAYVSYPFTEVAAIYPITPSSQMAELVDDWASHGRKNLFGQPVRVSEMQSEGGAAGTLHGALQAGALSSTYTASQGLLLMIPNMYKIAGELLPAVFHVSARALAANALSIFGDHQDVMAVRQTGFVLLAASNVQEVMDLGAVAHLSAVAGRLPFLHFFDGFRTSHETQKIEVLEYEELAGLLDMGAVKAFRDRALNPEHPMVRGTTQNPDIYFQTREAVNKFYLEIPPIIEKYMGDINRLTGRDYKLFNYYGAPDAERIIVAMGSACDTIRETIDYLTSRGEKVGLVDVHLYRPFSIEHLRQAVPASVRSIAVLDRTKEPGAAGEPLYLDVRNAFCGQSEPLIVGGRYGLGSKDFTPADVAAVYKNLKADTPKNGFTVSITDDVTFMSLPAYPHDIDTTPSGTTCCKFWGMGADGTVGANKNAIKIIGDHTEMYAQGYFAYDAKKSGGLTVSHLRFGRQPIRSSYLITKADFVACHHQSYIYLYDVLAGLKHGGNFVLNCVWTPDELAEKLPAAMKRYIAANNIQFYIINAVDIARQLSLDGRINMIMQAAFFKLTAIIPLADATRYLKDAVSKSYGKQGQVVIDMNVAAIDRGTEGLVRVNIPDDWKYVKDDTCDTHSQLPAFIEQIVIPMNRQKGDKLPVSIFNGREDGTFPLGITAWEKRGIAIRVPEWQPDNCIQCNQCAYVCSHAVIRPVLASKEEVKQAPADFTVRPATGFSDLGFHLAISSMDCTGCGNCVDVCPAKEKALVMKPMANQRPACEELWAFAISLPTRPIPANQKLTVKGSQFAQPLQEFSGACAGCGETPYAKLVTQLFGDRMMISNAAGCSTVWGATAPSISYATNPQGRGPAWGFSLFEDNAEYGFGMHLGVSQIRQTLAGKLQAALEKDINEKLRTAIVGWLAHKDMGDGTRERADCLIALLAAAKGDDKLLNEIYEQRDFFVKRSQWIFGGDGWAYDIGYGGLDHVLAAGEDVNVLVFDTEVYSNTGGQSSKATPTAAIAQFAASGKKTRKKDLGVMMMSYGYIYIAQVAMGADKNQTLRAIAEAEAFPGPSLIIAYAPCLNHGIQVGMGKSQAQAKRAVECGYWTLYRYNPQLTEQGKNPFVLDSKEPTASFQEFIRSEVRFSALSRQFPETAEALFTKAEEDARARRNAYKRLAETGI